jgi:hypothetical protein
MRGRQRITPSAVQLTISREEARRALAAMLEPDFDFIDERIPLGNVGEDDLLDAYRAAHIALLRSNIPLSRATRNLLSNELARLWWPKHAAPQIRKNKSKLDRYAINAMARVLKAKGVPNAKGAAEKEWARCQGVTVGALHQRRYRKK